MTDSQSTTTRYRPTPPPIPVRTPQPRKPKPVAKTRPRAIAPRPTKGRRKLPIRRELSAGGVAARQEGEQWLVALLQTEHKRGKVWVLPKGHVELHTGENISDAAKREVQEEAGLSELSVKNQLGVTKFKFQVEDALVYKTVHYFLMTTQQKQLTPQAEEGLLAAEWFPIEEAIKKLEYDTDQDIVSRARDRLLGIATRPRARSPHAGRPHKPTRYPMPRGGRKLRIHT